MIQGMMSVQMSNLGCIFPFCPNPKLALVEREEGRETLFCSFILSEANLCNSNFVTLSIKTISFDISYTFQTIIVKNNKMEIGCNTHKIDIQTWAVRATVGSAGMREKSSIFWFDLFSVELKVEGDSSPFS